MKLYTRLIDAGVFVFWSSDGDDTNVNLKIKIAVGDEKIVLIDANPTVGQNYYTFDHVGSGEYEIELNAFRNNVLYQTETKNIKIISTTQKNEENMQALLDRLDELDTKLSKLSKLSNLYNLLHEVNNALTDPQTIVHIKSEVRKYESVWGESIWV